MSDILRMGYINSLPQPFIAKLYGGSSWPVVSIDVETGMMHIDVVGKIECCHISDVANFVDSDGFKHDPDSFYADWEPTQERAYE